jgi:hypothetical protein
VERTLAVTILAGTSDFPPEKEDSQIMHIIISVVHILAGAHIISVLPLYSNEVSIALFARLPWSAFQCQR